MVWTNEQPIVGAYGDIYAADVGTQCPTDFDDVDTDAAWTKLGMISEDGASWTPPEEETADIKIWQTPYPARTVTTGLSSSLTFAMDGWDRNTVAFAMGGGTFTDSGSTVIYSPPKAGQSQTKALFMKVLDGTVKLGLFFGKGKVTGRDDTVFKPDEAALLNVEYSLQGDATLDPFNLVFDQATFPAGVGPATGATAVAGAQGSWTPSGATPPADLAAANATATANVVPATTWAGSGTLGVPASYVVLGNTTHCYWDGTTWVTGDAPATVSTTAGGTSGTEARR